MVSNQVLGGLPLTKTEVRPVLFNSAIFPFFLLVALGFYYATSRSHRLQNVTLVLLSYTFYAYWDPRCLPLLLISTLVDYLVGLQLGRRTDPQHRRLLLYLSLSTNLGLLGFFKYFNFFLYSVRAATGIAGEALHIILPVGISFYTFQSMSYSIDVYRKTIEPTRDPIAFACYVAFFPQLIAGPIERAARFLPQILAPRRTTWDQVSSGTYLILWGMYLKVFVGDGLVPLVRAFADPTQASPGELMLGSMAYTIKIYADFAGYSKIARGTARLMGFELCLNFNLPYLSVSPLEFWRRWHISLSSWLRDYLYIPLGGSRGPKSSLYRNLMVTMVLGGLWHGAWWSFLLWGLYHGLLLCLYRALPFLGHSPIGTTHQQRLVRVLARLFWTLLNFALVVIGFTIFRLPDVDKLGLVFSKLLASLSLFPWPGLELKIALLTFHAVPLLVADLVAYHFPVERWLKTAFWPLRTVWYLFLFYSIVLFGGPYGARFIYFQF